MSLSTNSQRSYSVLIPKEAVGVVHPSLRSWGLDSRFDHRKDDQRMWRVDLVIDFGVQVYANVIVAEGDVDSTMESRPRRVKLAHTSEGLIIRQIELDVTVGERKIRAFVACRR